MSHRGINRENERSFEEIAAQLGITRAEAFSAYRSGLRKLKRREEIPILRALYEVLQDMRAHRRAGKAGINEIHRSH